MEWDDLPGIATVADLERYGVPAPAARDKVLTSLGPLHRAFLAHAPLAFVATADAEGRCDVSPKGDPDGLALVLDDHTLVVPERPGNKRMDGFHNLLANPQLGLIFVVPGRADTLRVNGHARLVTDGPFFDDLVVRGHRPVLALLVHVEEVFYHCPKAFLRSRAWQPDTWRPDALPSYADAAKQLWRKGDPDEEVDRHYAPAAYEAELYRPQTPPTAAGTPTDS